MSSQPPSVGLWSAIPDPIKKIIEHSPFAFVLILVIYALMTGYLYTGRTHDREMSKCEQEVKEYKRAAWRGTRDLGEELSERARARHQPTLPPLRDAEAKTLNERLDLEEQAIRKENEKPPK